MKKPAESQAAGQAAHATSQATATRPSSGGAPAAQPLRPLPQPTDITRPYWGAAADHRLVIQKCKACGSRQFYPRLLCTTCMSDDIDWVESSGKGKVYTYTVNHRAPNAFMKARLPYVVAAIDLDDGVRMMANIIDSPIEPAKIGARVKVVFEDTGEGVTLPQFTLDTDAG